MFEEMAIPNKVDEEGLKGEVKTVKGSKCFYLKKMIGDYIGECEKCSATDKKTPETII